MANDEEHAKWFSKILSALTQLREVEGLQRKTGSVGEAAELADEGLTGYLRAAGVTAAAG